MTLKIALMAMIGPLMFIYLACGVPAQQGSGDEGDSDTTGGGEGTQTLSFSTDIFPIVSQQCGGTTCHSQGGSQSNKYAVTAAAFEANKASVKARINLSAPNNLLMPPGQPLAADQLKKLNDYLDSL